MLWQAHGKVNEVRRLVSKKGETAMDILQSRRASMAKRRGDVTRFELAHNLLCPVFGIKPLKLTVADHRPTPHGLGDFVLIDDTQFCWWHSLWRILSTWCVCVFDSFLARVNKQWPATRATQRHLLFFLWVNAWDHRATLPLTNRIVGLGLSADQVLATVL